MNLTDLPPFILSSLEPLPSDFFVGTAFFGTDFIIGQAGYDKYCKSAGLPEHDADGCYVEARKIAENAVRVSTDFRGYFPLFYYNHDDRWAVSPSLAKLAEFAVSHNWPLTQRRHQLDAFRSSRALTLQQTSNRTIFNEIMSLGYDEEIVLTNAIKISPKERTIRTSKYAEALSEMLSLWRSRFRTVLMGGLSARIDLSGGVDSRTILAILLSSLNDSEKTELLFGNSVKIFSQPSAKADFEVAQLISHELNFPLNNKTSAQSAVLAGHEAFEEWHNFNLGRYAPHILPVTRLAGEMMYFPGVGGEEHRPFYEKFYKPTPSPEPKKMSMLCRAKIRLLRLFRSTSGNAVVSAETQAVSFAQYIRSYRGAFASESDYDLWVRDIFDDLSRSTSPYDKHLSPAMKHYRRHRGRHHSAKKPASDLAVVIFGSRAFYECTYHKSTDEIERNQILFDVMYSCDPKLAEMRYDDPKKGPTDENRENLTINSVRAPGNAGVVYRGELMEPSSPIGPHGNKVLAEAVTAALSKEAVRRRLRPAGVKKVEIQVTQLGKGNLHDRGSMLHFTMLVDLALKVERRAE